MNKNDRKSEAVRTISDFISTFVVAIVAMVAIALVGIQLSGLETLNVESDSMAPAYNVNTLVLVKAVDPSTIKEGDVVTYVLNSEGVLVTHRVIAVDTENETFTTKGDANNVQDPQPVLWGNVVGKVIFSLPKLGKPLSFITAKENRPAVIAVIVVLGVLSLSWDFIDKKHKKKSDGASDDNKEDKPVNEEPEKAPYKIEPSDEEVPKGKEEKTESVRIGDMLESYRAQQKDVLDADRTEPSAEDMQN